MKVRYILHPGYIISKTDGDRHYIGVCTLRKLYNVDFRDCVCPPFFGYPPKDTDIHLYPDYTGNYVLPEK